MIPARSTPLFAIKPAGCKSNKGSRDQPRQQPRLAHTLQSGCCCTSLITTQDAMKPAERASRRGGRLLSRGQVERGQASAARGLPTCSAGNEDVLGLVYLRVPILGPGHGCRWAHGCALQLGSWRKSESSDGVMRK